VRDPGDDLKRLEPYLPAFRAAAQAEGEELELVGAICLRETEAGWARGYDRPGSHLGRGDPGVREWTPERAAATPWVEVLGPGVKKPGRVRVRPADGRGWGAMLFQFDLAGPYAHLPRGNPEATPLEQARWACGVLKDARRELVAEFGSAFASSPVYEAAVVASYNAGSPAVVRCVRRGLHPDHATTDSPDADLEGDYASDVLRRRETLRALLASGPVGPAPIPEPKPIRRGG
jgi:hypothetical protein